MTCAQSLAIASAFLATDLVEPPLRSAPAVLQAGSQCALSFVPQSFPPYTAPVGYIGYSGAGYGKADLLAPEPIPLGVSVADTDTIHAYCGGSCSAFVVPGAWTASWTCTAPPGEASGSFLDSVADLVDHVDDASHVLYVPPSDLTPGATRDVLVRADLVDACSIQGFADDPANITFKVTVTRTDNGTTPPMKFDIASVVESTNIPPQSPPPCPSPQTICQLITAIQQSSGPTVAISTFPSAGMVLGEVRMLTCVAEDIDRLMAECGTPPGYDPPTSHFGFTVFCDRLTYNWAVSNGPGAGTFIAQGRSALFRATTKGSITVQLTVTGTDGESAITTTSFTIHEPRVDRMRYKGSYVVAKDSDGTAYDPSPYDTFHWEDINNDRDAEDANEHRISVAYKRNTHVEIERVFIDCDTTAPPMAIIRGTGPDQQVFTVLNGVDPDAASDELVGLGSKASIALPDTIKKYEPYTIAWELSFGDDYFVPAEDTDTWLYVTLNDSAGRYRRYESVYDISCKAADGLDDDEQVSAAIRAEFEDREVRRKARDGFNVDDGKVLKYWAVSNPPRGVAGLLQDADGNGQCSGFAQLFKACHEIQGLSGGTIYKLAFPPENGTELLVKEWTVVGGGICSTGLLIDTEIVEANGIPAQGNPDPESRFSLHYIVLLGSDYYDPSYGTGPFTSQNAHEDAGIAAFSADGDCATLNQLGVLEAMYTGTDL